MSSSAMKKPTHIAGEGEDLRPGDSSAGVGAQCAVSAHRGSALALVDARR